jgi:hypothetical protein
LGALPYSGTALKSLLIFIDPVLVQIAGSDHNLIPRSRAEALTIPVFLQGTPGGALRKMDGGGYFRFCFLAYSRLAQKETPGWETGGGADFRTRYNFPSDVRREPS